MSTPLSIQGIIDLSSAFYGSAVLFAALELDLFTTLEKSHDATSEMLAQACNADVRGMRLLLDACVAIGLLTKTNAHYANTPSTSMTLVAGAPHDLTRAIRYNRDVYPAWARTADFVRSGAPVEIPEIHLGDDLARTERFVLSMHGRALGIGRRIVPLLDLAGCTRVLDLAGGPGTYAVLMAQAHPGLTCVSIDLPGVSVVAARLVATSNVAERVTCRAGDYHTDVYEEAAYDAVTIFGALHQESPAQIVSILKRAHAALRPSGKIFVLDMMTDATHTAPAFSALFAVNMALTTQNGWVFSDEELKGWLSEAGFRAATTHCVPPPMPHWLVCATKNNTP